MHGLVREMVRFHGRSHRVFLARTLSLPAVCSVCLLERDSLWQPASEAVDHIEVTKLTTTAPSTVAATRNIHGNQKHAR